jgi:hypothetical protein
VVTTLGNRIGNFLQDADALRHELVAAKIKYVVLNRTPMGIPVNWAPADGSQDELRAAFTTAYEGPELTVLRVY